MAGALVSLPEGVCRVHISPVAFSPVHLLASSAAGFATLSLRVAVADSLSHPRLYRGGRAGIGEGDYFSACAGNGRSKSLGETFLVGMRPTDIDQRS